MRRAGGGPGSTWQERERSEGAAGGAPGPPRPRGKVAAAAHLRGADGTGRDGTGRDGEGGNSGESRPRGGCTARGSRAWVRGSAPGGFRERSVAVRRGASRSGGAERAALPKFWGTLSRPELQRQPAAGRFKSLGENDLWRKKRGCSRHLSAAGAERKFARGNAAESGGGMKGEGTAWCAGSSGEGRGVPAGGTRGCLSYATGAAHRGRPQKQGRLQSARLHVKVPSERGALRG